VQPRAFPKIFSNTGTHIFISAWVIGATHISVYYKDRERREHAQSVAVREGGREGGGRIDSDEALDGNEVPMT
jgi:hypothetical protein